MADLTKQEMGMTGSGSSELEGGEWRRESLRLNIVGSRVVGEVKVKLTEKEGPTGLSGVELLSKVKAGDILMIH